MKTAAKTQPNPTMVKAKLPHNPKTKRNGPKPELEQATGRSDWANWVGSRAGAQSGAWNGFTLGSSGPSASRTPGTWTAHRWVGLCRSAGRRPGSHREAAGRVDQPHTQRVDRAGWAELGWAAQGAGNKSSFIFFFFFPLAFPGSIGDPATISTSAAAS